MKYTFSAELVQAIADILQKLPYAQVFQVLDAMRAVKPEGAASQKDIAVKEAKPETPA